MFVQGTRVKMKQSLLNTVKKRKFWSDKYGTVSGSSVKPGRVVVQWDHRRLRDSEMMEALEPLVAESRLHA